MNQAASKRQPFCSNEPSARRELDAEPGASAASVLDRNDPPGRAAPAGGILHAGLWMLGLCATLALLGTSTRAGAPSALTTAVQIRRLSPDEAGQALPVRLTGIVTYADPEWDMLFVQDATAGVFVLSQAQTGQLPLGVRVEVTGVTHPGSFTAVVAEPKLRRLGQGKLPDPIPISAAEFASGINDGNWVEVQGVIRLATEHEGKLMLTLEMDERIFRVFVRDFDGVTPDDLRNAKARLLGVCSVSADRAREVADVQLFVPSLSQVVITGELEDPFLLPLESLQEVSQRASAGPEAPQVHVQGVLRDDPSREGLVLEDLTGRIRFEPGVGLAANPEVAVEVVGSMSQTDDGPLLQAATLRRIGTGGLAQSDLYATRTNPPPRILTRVQDVRSLRPEEAQQELPVRLRGVITYIDSDWGTLFFQDPTAGIYVNCSGASLDLPVTTAVELEGVTAPGDYAPIVTRPRFRVLGRAPLPSAAFCSVDQASTGRWDSQWVRMEGVVQSISVQHGHLHVELAENGRNFSLLLPGFHSRPAPEGLIDALVSVRGACGTLFNQRRQLIGIRLFVPSLDFIRVKTQAPKDPYSLPIRQIADLLRFNANESSDHRVRVQGSLTHYNSGHSLFIQDETGGLFLTTAQSDPLQLGDRLDVVGFPAVGAYTPTLSAATFRRIGPGPDPVPAQVTAGEALSADFSKEIFDARLVQLKGRLLEVVRHSSGQSLLLQQGTHLFNAELEESEMIAGEPRSLRVGSQLAVTGVCSVQVDESRYPRAFRVLLRSSEDLRITTPAPWLTRERTLVIVLILVVAHVLGASAVAVLRRRIRHQTRLIRAQLEREAARERAFTDLVADAYDFIFAHDLEGRFTLFNRAGETLTGYSAEEALRNTIFDLIIPEQRDSVRERISCMAAGEPLLPCELQCLTRRNDLLTLEVTTRLIIKDGKPSGIMGIARDVSARQEVQCELERARDAAELANRAKSEFLANMSHEIRTPMNGVLGMINLLLDSPLSPEQRDQAETVRSSAESLLSIINDILDLSKIEAGRLHFEELDFDLREVVDSVLGLLADSSSRQGTELAALVPQEIDGFLRGDPGRLRQVLLNLAGNAIKFTRDGEVFIQVTRDEEDERYATLRFDVIDTGIGISPEIQKRLFQPFSQADTSTTRRYGGTGLGLVISKRLVEFMHGQIHVRSAPGKGSTFSFTARFEKQPPCARRSRRTLVDLQGARVLVVDDNATNRRILHHHIISWHLRNGSVANGPEAIRLLRTRAREGAPYDAMILDMQMPEMDGLTLAEAVRQDPLLASTRMILLASVGQTVPAVELRRRGIDACLAKPVRQSELFDCLMRVLSRDAAAERRQPKEAEIPAPILIGGHPPRVLVAEDNAVNQKVVLRQLAKLGCPADAVGNGLEVLEVSSRFCHNIILMDCQMPEMDGYEATRRLRAQNDNPSPYIIAMTANAMVGDREKCLAAGMDDYIAKPVALSDLSAALRRAQSREIPPPVAQGLPPAFVTRLQEVTGECDLDFGKEVIAGFSQTADASLAELHRMIELCDASGVARLAHSFKGASSQVGADALVESCKKLEEAANAGDLARCLSIYNDVVTEYSQWRIELEKYAGTAAH